MGEVDFRKLPWGPLTLPYDDAFIYMTVENAGVLIPSTSVGPDGVDCGSRATINFVEAATHVQMWIFC